MALKLSGRAKTAAKNKSDNIWKQKSGFYCAPVGELLAARKERKSYGLGRAKEIFIPLTPLSLAGFLAYKGGVGKIVGAELIYLGVSGAAAALAGGIAFPKFRQEIRKATHLVGKGLLMESKVNSKLKDFLSGYKYIIIDGKGRIKGTNRSRILTLGIGRLRLETKRILAGKY